MLPHRLAGLLTRSCINVHRLHSLKQGAALRHVITSAAIVGGRTYAQPARFEQANRYSIKNMEGHVVGYIAEQDGLGRSIMRNFLRLRRPFHATVLDANGNVVLKIHRPMFLLNTTITIRDASDQIIGEAHMNWHLWRRRYDLFTGKKQFGKIDAGFLSWDFDVCDADERRLGRVDKDWAGLARELFTDGNIYMVKMDMLEDAVRVLTYDERAVLLATAITIDNDYFSRHSGGGVPLPIPMGGAVPAVPGGAAGGVGAVGMGDAVGMAGGAAIGGMAGRAANDATHAGGHAAGGIADNSSANVGPQTEQPLNQWGDPISSVGDGKKYNEYGDELVSDEAAGGGLMDSMKDFFGEVKDFFDDE